MDGLWSEDASVHQASLLLLEEAAKYLGSLPANALTHGLRRKIVDHLERPGAEVHRQRIENVAKDRDWRERVSSGEAFEGVSRFTPEGLPVVQCLVLRGVINFRSPAHEEAMSLGSEHAERIACSIGRELADGMSIALRQVDADNTMNKRLLASWSRFEAKR